MNAKNVEISTPFPIEALPRVWGWIEPFRGRIWDDFSPQNRDDFVRFMLDRWDKQQSWAVTRDSELGGLITFEKLSPWLGTAHVTLKPNFHNCGIGLKACRLAVAEMFKTGIGKLACYPLKGNLAIGSLLVNLGAKLEAKLEAHTLCDGKPTDVWVYGLMKQNFEDKQNAASTDTVHSGDHRGGQLDRGLVPIGEAQDVDQHVEQRVVG